MGGQHDCLALPWPYRRSLANSVESVGGVGLEGVGGACTPSRSMNGTGIQHMRRPEIGKLHVSIKVV